ncbi:fimbrial biogenesis chaperone, partial [Pseudomonas viridiflava]|uniref:fimbrial biogenesis chaperone n=1 Tax=Pseudomonas viridiflava TaxID=33069 RepID=UPI0023F743E2
MQYTRNLPVPSDRESVYWLNVLEIPSKPTLNTDDDDYLQLRFRTRIKIFLRPKGLNGVANDAPEKLVVKYQPGRVKLENPTPYHVNISTLGVGSNADGGVVEAEMIAPYTTKIFELKRVRSSQHSPSVTYKSVND